MLRISRSLSIPESEIELTSLRAAGPGGQNVNKVATAVHLRFDINRSSLPEAVRARLLQMRDGRISREGIITIKAQRFRTQHQNRADALARLQTLLARALVTQRKRIATQPTLAARQRRMDNKTHLGQRKRLRGRVMDEG